MTGMLYEINVIVANYVARYVQDLAQNMVEFLVKQNHIWVWMSVHNFYPAGKVIVHDLYKIHSVKSEIIHNSVSSEYINISDIDSETPPPLSCDLVIQCDCIQGYHTKEYLTASTMFLSGQ